MAVYAQLTDADSTLANTDSSGVATALITGADSLKPREESGFLQSAVDYHAEDSILVSPNGSKALLYNKAHVSYENISLKAGYIEIDWNSNTVFAKGIPDSSGTIVQKPIFTEDGKPYQSETITYNFETGKGRIKQILTKEGEGFLHGKKVKKVDETVFYIKDASFTTCNHEHPHYRIRANRVKVISGKKIVTGPAYLEVIDIPTPLVVPFGIFPAQSGQSSGVIVPTYGENATRGFFLRNGGYYFAISDYIDLTLKGDIYTQGGWGLNATSRYKKRYRYNGNFFMSYARTKLGEEAQPNFSDSRDFNIRWTHNQDPKARPNSRFSANVNAGSSSYFRNNTTNTNDFLTNTLNSNISYTKSWAGKPYRLSLNLKHSQNTQTHRVDLTLPEVAFNVNRFFPLAAKNRIGKRRWYEKIGVQYTMNAQNRIETTDTSVIFSSETFEQARNGIRHNIPISASLKFFKNITFNPSINYTERWYFKSIERVWDSDLQQIRTDTVDGFVRAGDFNTRAQFTTKLYGMYSFRSAKVAAIRHVITPTVGFTYRPDFSTDFWGYYKDVTPDTAGAETTRYSPFEQGIYGGPSNSEQGSINFSLANTLEMKVRTPKDTANDTKKIKLLEGLGISTSYNMAAETFKWSSLNLNARTSMFKNTISVNYNSSYDFYALDSAGNRINTFYWDKKRRLARLTSATLALGLNLKSKQGSDKKEDKSQGIANEVGIVSNNWSAWETTGYTDFDVPWSLNINYNLRYSKPRTVSDITQALTFRGDVKLTKNWKIGFSSGYDLEAGAFTYTSLDFYRNLHCWELRFNWIPFGFQQSYNLSISVKASMLRDLKLERKRGLGDFQ